MIRVQKILSNYGYCSRRKAEELIQQGRVKVNGKKITIGDKATLQDEIQVDNKIVKSDKKIYLVFHKPIKCVTALTDDKLRTVMSYINIKERVFPIGRLDYHTSGLLLLTNDGDFANSIMHPRYEVRKTYLAELDREIKDHDIEKLRKGVLLEDGKTKPAKVRGDEKFVEITIHEGKNRIIRRMLEHCGYQVKRLVRIKIGKLSIGELKPGRFRTMTKKERELVLLR